MLHNICVIISNYFANLINSTPLKLEVGDGRALEAVSLGNWSLKVNLPDGKVKNCLLENVLYVPDLAHNLLSVSQMSLTGKIVYFYKTLCKITNKDNKLFAIGNKVGKLYMLNCFHNVAANCSTVSLNEQLWHRRFCHLGINNIRKLVKK